MLESLEETQRGNGAWRSRDPGSLADVPTRGDMTGCGEAVWSWDQSWTHGSWTRAGLGPGRAVLCAQVGAGASLWAGEEDSHVGVPWDEGQGTDAVRMWGQERGPPSWHR